MYPVKRQRLILKTKVGNHFSFRSPRRDLRVRQETKQSQPVADHHDDNAAACHSFRVKFHLIAVAVLQAAAVDIAEYGKVLVFCRCRRKNIQIQTILTHAIICRRGMQLFCVKIISRTGCILIMGMSPYS